MTKRIRLEEMKTVLGRPFRNAVRDDDGNPFLDPVKDSEGNIIKEVPRDNVGNPVPGAQPQIVYRNRTEPMKKEALKELLKLLYLSIPPDKLTRLDTAQGTRLLQQIAASDGNILELDDDIHKWVREKLQDEPKEKDKEGKTIPGIGIRAFGVNLYIVEEAVDNFERLHEPKAKEEGEEEEKHSTRGRPRMSKES